MTRKVFKNAVLICLFIIIQLCGQISAALSGRTAGIINIYTAASYICLFSRSLIWILLLKQLSLITVYPLTAVIYVLILPVSVFLFNEAVRPADYAGAFLIFSGIILAAAGGRLKAGQEAGAAV